MKRLNSVLTDDMDTCMITGYSGPYLEHHHVFAGPRKKLSEKYGFVAPLRADLHPNGVHCTWNKDIAKLDFRLKQMCQEWYEANVGSREEFIAEFGRNYLG